MRKSNTCFIGRQHTLRPRTTFDREKGLKLNLQLDNTWITSDTHFFHDNLCVGSTKWSDKVKCRPFDNAAQMNEVLIRNINDIVPEDSFLIHCGDFVVGAADKVAATIEIRNRIKCKNIITIKGNHDLSYKKFGLVRSLFYTETLYQIFEHRFSKDFYCTFCHYSMNTWNFCDDRQGYMLFGHSHGDLPESPYKTMDVGIDTNNYFPYKLTDVFERLKNRPPQGARHDQASRTSQ